ncbi:hypothetical protein [Planctomicrobium piriforme]|uniref:Tetratricopeptide repeat-containing protein n=1 Tax=Planctomicrobium piriforme TaxID=1576369 RepID=A0A1I3L589_9PLAN|nr:hypothetical protein [Planctomicrobium piriforme]SFI79897.1 hypothetical protein SAMN05421753_112144 [Planctomicrobium piriforme]
MRSVVVFCLCWLLLGGVPLEADEPISDFAQGLRNRGYFDTALEYVQQLQAVSALSDDARLVLLLERGLTLVQAVPYLTDPAEGQRLAALGEADLREFFKAAPQHPRAAQAMAALGNLLLSQESEKISEEAVDSSKPDRMQLVRMVIQESRGYLQQACDRHQTTWELYPVYLPEDQTDLRAARGAVEEMLIRSQFDLAQCTYWEAQTYPKGSAGAGRLYRQAGAEFEAIHQRYRSQIGGLYARLWQARCFQEQGDGQGIRIALGIYSEILEHHGSSPTMTDLKDRALRFRLVCLNTDFRRDYQLVIQEAEDWLSASNDRTTTTAGVAIQWQLCLALESKAAAKDLSPEQRLDLLQKAHARAYQLSWSRGATARRATEMLQRLTPVLEQAGRIDK